MKVILRRQHFIIHAFGAVRLRDNAVKMSRSRSSWRRAKSSIRLYAAKGFGVMRTSVMIMMESAIAALVGACSPPATIEQPDNLTAAAEPPAGASTAPDRNPAPDRTVAPPMSPTPPPPAKAPPADAPAKPPLPTVQPSPVQPPAEIDPVLPDPGDRAPL